MINPTTLNRLHFQHSAIRWHLQGFSEEQIRKQVQVENQSVKWSAAQNIAHLGAYQELVTRIRIPGIVAGVLTSFQPFKPDEDPDFLEWCTYSTNNMLDKLEETRSALIMLTERLSPDDLAQTATHTRYGTMNVEQWIEFFVLHEAHHIFTVFRRLRGLV